MLNKIVWILVLFWKKTQVSTHKSLKKSYAIQSSNTFLLVYKDGDVTMFNLISMEFCEALERWKYQWKLFVLAEGPIEVNGWEEK